MKKYSLIFGSFVLLAFASCTSKGEGGMSEAAKKNMEANKAIVGMFEKGDWSKAADYIDKDAIDHGAGPTGEDIKGVDNIMANFNKIGEMMGDMQNKVVKELADDEYVMSWMEQSSVPKVDAPEWGMKKGVKNTYNSIEVSKYNKDHKVTEHWSFMSMADMMKMMGGGGGSQMPMDTTHATPKDTTSK